MDHPSLKMDTLSDQQGEVYDNLRFAQLHSQSLKVDEDHLALATKFLLNLFERFAIPYAALGGWALYLRGSPRATQDIDIAVRSTTEIIKAILLLEPRVCVPRTHTALCFKIFVHTGGFWDGHCEIPENPVRVNIAIDENLGAAPGMPEGTEMILPVPRTLLGDSRVSVVDIFHQFYSKLQAHFNRRETEPGIDYADLTYLASTYTDAIHARCYEFSVDHRMMFLNDCDPGQTEWYRWLFGLEI